MKKPIISDVALVLSIFVLLFQIFAILFLNDVQQIPLKHR